MTGFILKTKDHTTIRFRFYHEAAPVTCAAFSKILPFDAKILHARISGEEIWVKEGPELDIIQENASIFTIPGEIAIGPKNPPRNKVVKGIGIFYGEGKLLDCANIFAKVYDEDLALLKTLGEKIWLEGSEVMTFDLLDQ